MLKKDAYAQYDTLPAYENAIWKSKDSPELLNDTDVLLWSGKKAPPKIGERVHIYMMGGANGTVMKYFSEYHWLGVTVKLDELPPHHRVRDASTTWHCFGVDFDKPE